MSEQYNAQQLLAVQAGDGPVAIVAGPGTGKTRTLTARIAYLVHERGVPAKEILALTFTNKAAREMQERIGGELAGEQVPFIATFHALANKICPMPEDMTLVTEIERAAIIEVIRAETGTKLKARDIGLLISRAKNLPHMSSDAETVKLVEAFNTMLQKQHAYDYDDLLHRLYNLLDDAAFRKKLPFTHILIDEFQDTNELQYEIIKRLNTTDNLFVIGDPLQSIYGFRGASSHIFDQFAADFPGLKRITLGTNYRSAPEIVQTANHIFPNGAQLRAHRSQPGIVRAVECLNEHGEADWILASIEQQVGGRDMDGGSRHHAQAERRTFTDFAVLTRTHAAVRSTQHALQKSGIPFQVVGEGSPYEQPHATLIIQAFGYLAGLMEPPVIKNLTAAQVKTLLKPLKSQSYSAPLTVLAAKILQALGMADHEPAREFTNTLVHYDHLKPDAYVAHIQKIAEQEYYDPAAGAVTLLTIHASKGLEFPVIFLAAAEEGILPLARHGQIADLEEEKRLFYVAVTRARDELYMLHARKRRGQPAEMSQFVRDLPASTVPKTTDPNIPAQLSRIQRSAQKRAQSRLF